VGVLSGLFFAQPEGNRFEKRVSFVYFRDIKNKKRFGFYPFFLDGSPRFSTLVFTAFFVWKIVGKAEPPYTNGNSPLE